MTKEKKPKIIGIDIDGTLKGLDDILNAYQIAVEREFSELMDTVKREAKKMRFKDALYVGKNMAYHQIKRDEENVAPYYKIFALQKFRYVLSQDENGKKILNKYYKLRDGLFKSGEFKIFDGAVEFIAKLKKGGNKVYIITSNYEDISKEAIEAMGLSKYIDGVYGRRRPEESKKEVFRRAYEELGGIDIYIGDTPLDMKMARKLGAIGLGVVECHGKDEIYADLMKKKGAKAICTWEDLGDGLYEHLQ